MHPGLVIRIPILHVCIVIWIVRVIRMLSFTKTFTHFASDYGYPRPLHNSTAGGGYGRLFFVRPLVTTGGWVVKWSLRNTQFTIKSLQCLFAIHAFNRVKRYSESCLHHHQNCWRISSIFKGFLCILLVISNIHVWVKHYPVFNSALSELYDNNFIPCWCFGAFCSYDNWFIRWRMNTQILSYAMLIHIVFSAEKLFITL